MPGSAEIKFPEPKGLPFYSSAFMSVELELIGVFKPLRLR
jgi:hypothetical protein